ncbi:VapE domain-containing protein [Cylindrospermum sp. FACHB-282]|uniref:VapE domain-containing protein n=1 Tax=Cylindrospermum sp. FACHB-282 TaxID=2692794 RepID=UPI001688897B|nr:VapE domain-containing protein [Cylindrospermum sp. FACHB-282]MBD2388449.1 DUF3854 domain-containing protein [Cylindrospermum sp. FACHB-282]
MPATLDSTLDSKHFEEWQESAVSDDIINLNVQTIFDPREVNKILGRNSSRKWGLTSDLVPAWYAAGVDPITDEPTLQGVQVKPDKTPIGKDGKPTKYIGASGMETAPLFLRTKKEGFWKSIIDDLSQWVFTCEGAKKSGSLLSINIPAISIPGVTTCRKLGRLHQNLALFAKPGRNIVLCYDNDLMYKKGVQDGLEGMGRELRAAGAKVWVILLPEGDAKGVDDFLALYGEEAFRGLLKSPETLLTFEEWLEKKKELQTEEEVNQPKSRLKIHDNLITREWGDHLRYNTLKKEVELDGKELNEDRVRLRMARDFDIDISNTDAHSIVLDLAERNSYSPVVEYLNECASKHPDIEPNFLDNLAQQYFGSEIPMHSIYFKNFLAAAVARARNPGCQVDSVFMLVSPKQGKYKSTFFRVLFGDNFFSDQLGADISSKDERMKISKYWCLEWAEFEKVYKRGDVSTLKNFITNREDTYRSPYARKDLAHPRPCVFVGTSNETEILHDPTGDRRFWIVPVTLEKVPIMQVMKDRDKIWAAANKLQQSGYRFDLTDEQEEIREQLNRQYHGTDFWDEIIEELFEQVQPTNFLSTLAIAKRLGFDEARQFDTGSQNKLKSIMKRLGFVKATGRFDGIQTRDGWKREIKKSSKIGVTGVTEENSLQSKPPSCYTPVTPPVTGVTEESLQEYLQHCAVTPVTPPVTETYQPEALQNKDCYAVTPVTPQNKDFETIPLIQQTSNRTDESDRASEFNIGDTVRFTATVKHSEVDAEAAQPEAILAVKGDLAQVWKRGFGYTVGLLIGGEQFICLSSKVEKVKCDGDGAKDFSPGDKVKIINPSCEGFDQEDEITAIYSMAKEAKLKLNGRLPFNCLFLVKKAPSDPPTSTSAIPPVPEPMEFSFPGVFGESKALVEFTGRPKKGGLLFNISFTFPSGKGARLKNASIPTLGKEKSIEAIKAIALEKIEAWQSKAMLKKGRLYSVQQLGDNDYLCFLDCVLVSVPNPPVTNQYVFNQDGRKLVVAGIDEIRLQES